jgi:hypothetical protein
MRLHDVIEMSSIPSYCSAMINVGEWECYLAVPYRAKPISDL